MQFTANQPPQPQQQPQGFGFPGTMPQQMPPQQPVAQPQLFGQNPAPAPSGGLDLFSGTTMAQAPAPAQAQPPTGGFDLFSTPSAPQPAPVPEPQQTEQFDDFVEAKAPEPAKPKKDDAWSKGSSLFDLSNLKSDT